MLRYGLKKYCTPKSTPWFEFLKDVTCFALKTKLFLCFDRMSSKSFSVLYVRAQYLGPFSISSEGETISIAFKSQALQYGVDLEIG
jgi:hypothetical protein